MIRRRKWLISIPDHAAVELEAARGGVRHVALIIVLYQIAGSSTDCARFRIVDDLSVQLLVSDETREEVLN